MTQNINDTMVKQMYMRQRMHAIVEQSLLKPQSFPSRAPQKEKIWGFEHDESAWDLLSEVEWCRWKLCVIERRI